MAEPRERNLSKSQEELAQAAKERANATQEAPALTTGDKVELGAYAPLAIASGLELTDKLTDQVPNARQFSPMLNAPLTTGTNVISRASQLATNPLVSGFRGASLFSPLGLYTAADIGTSMLRDDGKTLSNVIGDFAGGTIGNMMYGDGSQNAFTSKERKAMQDGLDINKPIYASRKRGGREIVGYEPLPDYILKERALDDARTGTTQDRASYNETNATPQLFDTSFEQSGDMVGLPASVPFRDSETGQKNVVKLTPEQQEQMNADLKAAAAPIISGTPREGLTAFADQQGNTMYGNQDAIQGTGAGQDAQGNKIQQSVPFARGMSSGSSGQPMSKNELANAINASRQAGGSIEEKETRTRALVDQFFQSQNAPASAVSSVSNQPSGTGMSSIADKMIADFVRFQDSGKDMTPEMEKTATDLGASVGRTFDRETGYGTEFQPEILEAYNKEVAEGRIDSDALGRGESNLDIANRERKERQEKEKQEFESNRSVMEEERKLREETGGRTISVGGQQVPATKENVKRRNLEIALKKKGRAEGLRGSALNAFVTEELEKRDELDRQQAQNLKDEEARRRQGEIDLERSEIALELDRQRLAGGAIEKPKPNTFDNFVDTAQDTFSLNFDPETFTFNTVEEGGLFFRDKEHPLNPNSQRYRTLSQMEGAEYFFQAPPNITDNLDEYAKLASEAEPDSRSGKQFVAVRADDGRVFEIDSLGRITHTGYSAKEL
jgi:hypothetical protein